MRTFFAGHSLRPLLTASLLLLALACVEPDGGAPTAPERPLTVTPSVYTLVLPVGLLAEARGGPAGAPVVWESSDASVAAVSASGEVAPRSAGSAVITARRGAQAATLLVTVRASRLAIDRTQVLAPLGGTQPLTATVYGVDDVELRGIPVRWSSADPGVATVDSLTGVVTGMSAGHTTVVAIGGGVSAAVPVYVDVLPGAAFSFGSVSLGSGANHLCALDTMGAAYCWGDNHAGAMGTGETAPSDVPIRHTGTRRYSGISVAHYATCAVEAETGSVFCWGNNSHGQLGHHVTGTFATLWEPTRVATAIRFAEVSSGGLATCGIEMQTRLGYCWGKGGLVGDGTPAQRSSPSPIAGGRRFASVRAGPSHACGIEAGTGLAFCWGENAHGQLGDGTTTTRQAPVPVGGGIRFASISVGYDATCGVEAETGRAYCWGTNSHGQVGDGSVSDRSAPTAVTGDLRFGSIDAGTGIACGVQATTGTAFCWGHTLGGHGGESAGFHQPTPRVVGDGTLRFASVDAGGHHWLVRACGIQADTGYLLCWGSRLAPEPVPTAPTTTR